MRTPRAVGFLPAFAGEAVLIIVFNMLVILAFTARARDVTVVSGR
jgi:hypothetical protein